MENRCFKPRLKLPVLDIINEYNAEIRGLYNYYCFSSQCQQKDSTEVQIHHYFSMPHTIARKRKYVCEKGLLKSMELMYL